MSEENQAATTEAPVAKPKKKETVYTKVTMEDQREVQFAGTRRTNKEILGVGDDGAGIATGVRFDFRNGKTRQILLTDVPEKTRAYAAAHGLSQKIGDEWSNSKELSDDDIVLTCDEMIARLKGEDGWFAETTGGDSMAGTSVVLQALTEVTGKSLEQAKAFIEKKIADAKARGESLSRQQLYLSLRRPDSKTGQAIRRIEEEKAMKNAKFNADELAAELEAEATPEAA